MSLLENINSPGDLKGLTDEQLGGLAKEIRGTIIDAVSQNGGHLASNLGVVEATLALHKVFDSPGDRILFDVSHQCYTHKILTGRYKNFSTLRKSGGISGFSNPAESAYDPLYEGHCGTSISQALAFATADAMDGKKNYTVAVVGDGAFTNGMIYEALNNCSVHNLRLIILLNDNEMCISGITGGMNKMLRRMRSSSGYFRIKHGTQKVLRKIPFLGKGLILVGRRLKNFVKNILLNKNIFENYGLEYIGPVDGNNIKRMCSALAEAKRREACCVVHMYTKKGLGYEPAEKEPALYHSVSPFDPAKGVSAPSDDCFSEQFGKYLCEKADENSAICAITAAMTDGTGLSGFAAAHPERFFDVGIAEEHAVTFGAALSAAGKLPVCAVYSTFAQRAYDQLFQDVSLGGFHFVLALDRCGFVAGDGVTHQGLFDYSLFCSLPGCTVYSPATYKELKLCMDKALSGQGLQIVRYPKGKETGGYWNYSKNGDFAFTAGAEHCKTIILTYGRIAANALPCVVGGTGIVRLVKAFPFDLEELERLTAGARNIYLLEEGIFEGGMAQKLSPYFTASGKNVAVRAVYGFVKHGSFAEICAAHGFSPEQIAEEVKTVFGRQ